MYGNTGDVQLKDSARSYVDAIRKSKNNMDNIFNTFTDSVNRLKMSGGFESKAGNEFYSKYEQLKPHYSEFIRLFEEFASDYEMAIENAEKADVAVQSAAETIQNTN